MTTPDSSPLATLSTESLVNELAEHERQLAEAEQKIADGERCIREIEEAAERMRASFQENISVLKAEIDRRSQEAISSLEGSE